jgi:ectoine hydroxylase-related dioxygenase (phytanoyl-CoA dioxygenase family)
MEQYEYEKYKTTKEGLMTTIEEYGVAIIPSVLNENECNEIIDGLWDYFEHITKEWEVKINRNDKKTWREIYKLYPLHSMLFQYWSAGHTQVSWNVRQNPKMVDIFANLWKTDDLLVSFDGLSFHLPPEDTNKGWNRQTFYHTDQSFTQPGFQCIQSWTTAYDVNEGDATLAFMEKSNRYHKDFGDKFEIKDKSNWYKLSKEQEQFYLEKGCDYKKIKCPKGSLVLWDSRTIHCGVEPLKERTVPNVRAIIYLCYMPKHLCNKKELDKKKDTFNELRTTSHYPCNIKLFPKNPRTYGGILPKITQINKPILNELGLKLAGL